MKGQRLSPGIVIDDTIVIEELLGEGGMGSVYRARHLTLDNTIAVKTLSALQLDSEERKQRFKREAQALSSLSHPNVVRFFKYGVWQDRIPYIAMEYLVGTGLDKMLDNGEPLPAPRIKAIAAQVAEALDYAHHSGIVHRDLKPANMIILQDSDTVKLVDFGLARFLPTETESSAKLTQTGLLIGSVDYMSPEQCLHKEVDERSDIYSLGCVIYHMLTGKAPFSSENPLLTIQKQTSEDAATIPPAILSIGKEYRELATIASTCMRKDPAERYQTAAALLDDLKQVGAGKISEFKSKRRGKKLWLILLPTAIASLLLCAFCIYSGNYPIGLETAFLATFAQKQSLPFWLKESERLKKLGKAESSVELLNTLLKQASRWKINTFEQAEIELRLAEALDNDGFHSNESLEIARKAMYDFAHASDRIDWSVLIANGITDDVSQLTDLLNKLQVKKEIPGLDTMASLLSQHKEHTMAIKLQQLNIDIASTAKKFDYDESLDVIAAKQQELAIFLLNAGMKDKACAEMKSILFNSANHRRSLRHTETLNHLVSVFSSDPRDKQALQALSPFIEDTKRLLAENANAGWEHCRGMQFLADIYWQMQNKSESKKCVNAAQKDITDHFKQMDAVVFYDQARLCERVKNPKLIKENLANGINWTLAHRNDWDAYLCRDLLNKLESLYGWGNKEAAQKKFPEVEKRVAQLDDPTLNGEMEQYRSALRIEQKR